MFKKKEAVDKPEGYRVSVAFNCTMDTDGSYIDETALVFDDKGKTRFWILKYDVRNIYDGKTLEEAKNIYREEVNKGNIAFWSDYDVDVDSTL